MTVFLHKDKRPSDALFKLSCGCITDGYSDSDPGVKFREGVRNGTLFCVPHGPVILEDVVYLK